MKFTAILMVVCSLQLSARGFSQAVSLRLKDAPLAQAFKQIEKQTDYTFVYGKEQLKQTKEITITVSNQTVEEVLNLIFKDQPLTYTITDKYIAVKQRPAPPPDNTATPAIDISGKVANEKEEPLQGVTVTVKGTKNATQTGPDGTFSISIPGNRAILVFSYVGYEASEISVNGNSTAVNVILKVRTTSLNEIVVTGYSSQVKRDISGSVVSVDADDVKATPASNFANQLQGRAAGVLVSNDNTPGGGVAIRIRGVSSISSNSDPLYVIDGVPTKGDVNSLNPNDIESIQILKDASAASVYGARANNGVIVITTKKGKAGKINFTYNMYEGIQVPKKGPDLLTPQEYADIQWANYKNMGLVNPDGTLVTPDKIFGGGATPVLPDYLINNGVGVMAGDPRIGNNPIEHYAYDPQTAGYGTSVYSIQEFLKNGFDWYDAIYNPAPIRNHNIGFSGGTENGRYAVGLDYFDQNGIAITNKFKRYTIRANTEFTLKNVVRVGENFQVSYIDNVGTGSRSEYSPINQFYNVPFAGPYDIAGNYTGNTILISYNPVAMLERAKDNHTYNTRFFGNIYGEVDLFKKLLTFRTSVGIDFGSGEGRAFNARFVESPILNQVPNVSFSWNKAINMTYTNTLTFKKQFGGHNVQVLAGTEAITNKAEWVGATKTGYAFTDPNSWYFDAGSTPGQTSGSASESSLFSLFAKLDYSLNKKYLLSATIRRDGSSRFIEANRYGIFPAFSLGWIVSEESFLKNISAIDFLKLRVSWGVTGNQDIGDYAQYGTYHTNSEHSNYPLNGGISGTNVVYQGYEMRGLGNEQARWEEQKTTNLGIDAGLFKHLTFTAEWYKRTVDNLILNVPIPMVAGANWSPDRNIGKLQNTGVDLSLNYNGKGGKDFTYQIGINWSNYKNKVLALYGDDAAFYSGQGNDRGTQYYTRTVVGQPISSFYGFISEGIFHSQAEADKHPVQFADRNIYNQAGRMKFKDIDGDGDVDNDDQTIIGSPHPDFSYGINLSAAYKGFDATLFLFGQQGNDIYNARRQTGLLMYFGGNRDKDLVNHWSETNTSSNIPSPNANATQEIQSVTSTYFLEKGSYLRAKNLQLGYTFPASLTSKIGFGKIRLYVQGSNLFTITGYKGLDPEINLFSYNVNGSEQTRGVDFGIYPSPRIFLIGLQAGF